MNLFAIKHKPTGLFMPVPTGRNGSGSSYWEPVEDFTVGRAPRFFPTKRSATSALTQWLRGRHAPVMETENEGFGTYQVCVGTEVQYDPSRKAEDMEIVEFTLTETV